MEQPLLRWNEALAKVRELGCSRELGTERVALESARGRVLANDLTSPENVPAWDNSAMDGFAVRARETEGASPKNPVRLRILGAVAAGDPGVALSPERSGSCYEIMTGAPVPPGADAIVKVEDTGRDASAPGEVLILKPARAGDHLRRAGEDFRTGDPVLKSGTILEPQHFLALAGLGLMAVQVRRKPSVALIATGRELVDPIRPQLAPGEIRNSTGPFLAAALSLLGCDVRSYGIVADHPEEFRALLLRILRESGPDLILTTGAVSMGKYDFVAPVLRELGIEPLFHKVAMRPGKPILFADTAALGFRTAFFGLPGNPVSTFVGLRFFVEPYLRCLSGRPPEQFARARLANETRKPEGMTCFYKARLRSVENPEGNFELKIEALSGQASFQVSPLEQANAWAILSDTLAGSPLRAGTVVETAPLWPDSIIQGGS